MPRKITIFEPHFHDAQFGPTVHSGGSERTTESAEEAPEQETESGGSSGLGKFFALAVIGTAIGIIVYKKMLSGENHEIEIEDLSIEEQSTTQ